MNRILITGGSGFLGTNLVEHYVRRGDAVLNLDPRPPRNPEHKSYWQSADLLDAKRLRQAISDWAPEWIYHMAARTDLDGVSLDDYSANTTGLENLISVLRDVPSVKRVVFASSRLVCRIGYRPSAENDYCPTTFYGDSKAQGEEIVRKAAPLPFEWVIVRPTSIWGPWFDVPYRDFFMAIRRGIYIHPAGRMIRKAFGYVGNTVYELDRLITADHNSVLGRTVYLADYPPIEVRALAEKVRENMNAPRIRDVPMPLLRAMALAGDAGKRLGWKSVPLTSFRLNNLITEMLYDLDPLAGVAGALPYSMADGVGETVKWLRQQSLI